LCFAHGSPVVSRVIDVAQGLEEGRCAFFDFEIPGYLPRFTGYPGTRDKSVNFLFPKFASR